MNKGLLSFLLPVVLLAVVYSSSCKKATKPSPELSATEAYFPLQTGKYIIYDVDSTYWDSFNCVIRTYKCQIRYSIEDTFTDKEGRLSYRIETFFRKKADQAWTPQEVMYATNTGTVLEEAHSGFRFIKMQFPVRNADNWKGNALINTSDSALLYFADWDYQYSDVGAAFNNGKVMYTNTATVVQRDETINNPETLPAQFASRTYGKEVFGYGVGMVYREYFHWTYDASAKNNHDPNNSSRCMEGTGVIMRAIDHN